MKIIIDIPDSFRNALLEGSLTNDQILEVYRAVRNGVILPKGHGRLVDIDEVIKDIEDIHEGIWVTRLINSACSKRIIVEAESEE